MENDEEIENIYVIFYSHFKDLFILDKGSEDLLYRYIYAKEKREI